MIAVAIVIAALTVDAWLGEARRFHPLVGFGRIAGTTERLLYGDARWRGIVALALLLVPAGLLAAVAEQLPLAPLASALLLYVALGWKSLGEHAVAVRNALLSDDLAAARQSVGRMVSRDSSPLDGEGVAAAAVESVLENGNDAVFAAIFWFLVAGAPGVVLYRLANTLDAMWGYRNERYRHFGWAAARLDDLLNYLPARLTAIGYALAGTPRTAWRCWRTQAARWDSPNAGPVMAAGAGSLMIGLGGPACYQGVVEARPTLGVGPRPQARDIDRALRLVRRALLLWLAVAAALFWTIDHAALR